MVGLHIFIWGGPKALTVGTYALGKLLFAGGSAEIGGGASHIVDVSLKILVLHYYLSLPKN